MALTTTHPPLWRESRMGLELAALLRDPVFRGRGRDRRPRPAGAADPGLHGRRRPRSALMARWLKGTGHHPSRAGIRSNVACSGADDRTPGGSPRAPGRPPGPARRHRRPQPRRAASPRCSRAARPDLVSGIVHARLPAGRPARRPPGGTRPTSRRSRRLGQARRAGLLLRDLPGRRLLLDLLGALRGTDPARGRLRVGLLAHRRHRSLAGLPRPRRRARSRSRLSHMRHGGAPRRVPGGGRLARAPSAAATRAASRCRHPPRSCAAWPSVAASATARQRLRPVSHEPARVASVRAPHRALHPPRAGRARWRRCGR